MQGSSVVHGEDSTQEPGNQGGGRFQGQEKRSYSIYYIGERAFWVTAASGCNL